MPVQVRPLAIASLAFRCSGRAGPAAVRCLAAFLLLWHGFCLGNSVVLTCAGCLPIAVTNGVADPVLAGREKTLKLGATRRSTWACLVRRHEPA
ncbi:hypothetical protein [Kibdelosporangium philippinense]|uniref:hypothetical protein n=1 Tax=Kibdelosporangium philippinense TaxID=211113 RepID=UPI003606058F